jgi:hypothetical protein
MPCGVPSVDPPGVEDSAGPVCVFVVVLGATMFILGFDGAGVGLTGGCVRTGVGVTGGGVGVGTGVGVGGGVGRGVGGGGVGLGVSITIVVTGTVSCFD